MAIYFGDWHVDPDMASIHGENWTEWEVVVNGRPRYPGHFQPNLPLADGPAFGRAVREDTPAAMLAKVQTAQAHGVTAFMFDWYWYAEKGHGAKGGGFLNGALDDGFLQIPPGGTDMKFSLMWANQDWVDIHPAKRGWHGTGRGPPNPLPIVQPGEGIRGVPAGGGVNMLMQFEGYMNSSVYGAAFKNVVDKYMTHPNYYRVPTRLANGTVTDCAYFAIYQMPYFVDGVGGIQNAQAAMDGFRAYAESQGQCVHLVAMVAGSAPHMSPPTPSLKALGVDSTTAYCWMKIMKALDWPESNYTEMVTNAPAVLSGLADYYRTSLGVKFAPSLSVAWDSSPRTLPSDEFFRSGYPWGSAFHSTPETWTDALQMAKTYMDKTCGAAAQDGADAASAWCPPLIINAWNEWSEGAYLEPDQQFGYGKLKALQSIFGPSVQ